MWGHTRTHHTEKKRTSKNIYSNFKKNGWRDSFEELLKTHSEQGLYLKGLRLREAYTQAELGKLIGVHQNNISAMERGARPIGKEIAQKLAAVFGVKYQKFL